MDILVDMAIKKLNENECEIFGIQLPFIVFVHHGDFYKCTMTEILRQNDINSIISLSKIPETISDLT